MVGRVYGDVLAALDPAHAQGFLGCLSTLTAGVLGPPHVGTIPRRRPVPAPPPRPDTSVTRAGVSLVSHRGPARATAPPTG